MKKISIIPLIMICFIHLMIPFSVSAISEVQPSGTGTLEDPYIIAEAGNLIWMSTNNSSNYGFSEQYFYQNTDITLSGEWTPIGSGYTCYFSGTYEANGHTVTGISITSATADYNGLFGYNNGIIKDLGVEVNINCAKNYVGGLAGYSGGTIDNCYSMGTIAGNMYSGGLVGKSCGTLKECNSSANITGTTHVGGLAGESSYSGITKCFSTGTVNGNGLYIGGLVGISSSLVNDSYSTGNVTGGSGSNNVGGLLGASYQKIYNCYATGEVNGGTVKGGLIGQNYECVTNCFSINGFIGNNNSKASYCYFRDPNVTYVAVPTEYLQQNDVTFYKTRSTYTTASNWNTANPWDFANIWMISPDENSGYPTLTYAVTTITLNKTAIIIPRGQTETIIPTLAPYNATNKNVTWTSSDSAIASVDSDGKVTANKSGTAVITACASGGGVTAKCKVTVLTPVGGIAMNISSITMKQGEKVYLTATVLPDDAFNKATTWTSGDKSVVTVDEGFLTAINTGTATITATTVYGDYTESCIVTVVPPEPVTGITLQKSAMTILIGTTDYPLETILPYDAGDTSVTWTSSNKAVATVNEYGGVTAVAKGTATITATTADGGFEASCEVKTIPALPQSKHPYSNNMDTTWSYTLDGDPASMGVAFSSGTHFEDTYDYLYISDGSDNLIGTYTGNQLSGRTVIVPGATVKIRLSTDRYTTDYGFEITRICPAVQVFQDFNEAASIPEGWSASEVSNLSGTAAGWSVTAQPVKPSCTPYSGSQCVMFNSYDASNKNSARLNVSPQNGLNIPARNVVTLSFYMYNENNYDKNADYVQPQYSTDGGANWVNIGSPIFRYGEKTGWNQYTLPLDGVTGSDVLIGLLGFSAYGDNIFIDNIEFTANLSNTRSDVELLNHDKESLAIGYGYNNCAEYVNENMTLPSNGASGLSSVTWVSDKPDVISNDGVVTCQDFDTQVTLTATITVGNEIDTRTFTVTVIAWYVLSDATYIQNGKEITNLKEGNITCCFTTKRYLSSYTVVALYDGTKLISTTTAEFHTSTRSSVTFGIDVYVPSECDKLKLLAFENRYELMPLYHQVTPLLRKDDMD